MQNTSNTKEKQCTHPLGYYQHIGDSPGDLFCPICDKGLGKYKNIESE